MDLSFIINKLTIIEVLTATSLLYIFPKISTSTLLVSSAYKYYKFYSRKPVISSFISNTHMNSAMYGSDPEKYKILSIPVPKIDSNQILIQVKAASISPGDLVADISKIPFIRWLGIFNIGFDFSGVIMDIGSNVTKFQRGDNVFGTASGGTLQEFTVTNAAKIALKPANLSFSEAASLGVSGCCAYNSLNHFRKPISNDKILIIGASGGCGSFAIQIAKSYGATVYGVCSNKNVDYVKQLGSDHVLDYTDKNYLDTIKNIKFDLIVDAVSNSENNQEIIFTPYLAENGKYLAISYVSIVDFFRSRIGCDKNNYHCILSLCKSEILEELSKLIESNLLKPMPLGLQKFEFNEVNVNKGFDILRSKRAVGKIVFEI